MAVYGVGGEVFVTDTFARTVAPVCAMALSKVTKSDVRECPPLVNDIQTYERRQPLMLAMFVGHSGIPFQIGFVRVVRDGMRLRVLVNRNVLSIHLFARRSPPT
ncbi:hypothetical protein J8I87_36620 [Paraburkholderia sp. LEh10]|uniref:hypothetical protein n=1 Tax=Paraburkholderia sp. LEh10 TaxID=2821353 RepID=UPI001AEB355C|nr:hypothetical protein [Paraburkholderia sp. LEh10]MBP0595087.1 hypothetical protein [Paraburkholderia sp. LEh10]